MLKNILKENGVQEIKKNQQKSINGGNGNPACAQAISIDGTLCLCLGWYPQNGVCVNGNQ
ncbi:hypothetical protein J8L88_22640 [Aquimarina sp. MMG015]|uniref:hypothetical protein n=1 Tax=Aquimarina TaxID=290174 RepID=UPI0003FFAE92|nr:MULTISPECIES: hypothetical protein [Aquimarina]AXT58472.1 hypothetical protein D1815_22945 [Aquimarina sp. AD1]MBQ4805678.1 hypothetical protein [Aquimarina sp. MMG015]RKN16019.1 hypothetical protein D7035_15790 [Aquimarina sp. AD1]